jgi:hypothetical protein
MREWTILVREKPSGEADLVAVPSGFSWGAFFFQALWALYRRAWFTALALLVAGTVIPLAGEAARLAPGAMVALQLATGLILAFAANEIRIAELHLRRYRTLAIFPARSLDEAELRGFRLWLAQGPRGSGQPASPAEPPAAPGKPLWQP